MVAKFLALNEHLCENLYMKKSIILLLSIICISCKKQDNLILKKEGVDKFTNTNSVVVIDKGNMISELLPTHLDWTGIPLNIIMERGISNNKKFLSTSEIGHYTDLFHVDDLSGRQRWLMEDVGGGFFKLKIYTGVSNNRQYLSATQNGSVVDLHYEVDGSGRQLWSLVPLGNDLFNVKISGGISTGKHYLSSTTSGDKVDLYNYDDGSGRQQWKLKPAGEFDLVELKYYLNPDDVVKTKPSFVTSVTVNNGTNINQSMNINFSKKAIESSTYNRTLGLSITSATTFKAGVPFIASVSSSINVVTSGSWAYGQNESKEDSQSYSFTAIVPANKTVVAKAIVSMSELTTNYIATFRHNATGAIKKVQGRWTGIQASSVYYELIELQTGTVLGVYHPQ